MITDHDLLAIRLTLQLATLTTFILLLIGTPLAWWLSRYQGRIKPMIEALIALPLVLPPTVLGFYLLIAFSPTQLFGGVWQFFDVQLSFSFTGVLIASIIYSLPFVVQPLQSAFSQLSNDYLIAAANLGASRLDQFFSIILPITKNSFIVASTIGFAHTVGEFGIVLMIGGNIPGETQVISIALYDHVESLDYAKAHQLAFGLLIFSVVILTLVYRLQSKQKKY